MFDYLIGFTLLAIITSLGFGLYFLVNDRGQTRRTVVSLTIRASFGVLLLVLLALGFMSEY